LLASAQQAFSPETLHEFRLAAKRTRYLFELAPEGSASKKAIEQLRAVQDSVGEWHDWLTLTTNARKRLSAHSALLSALENTTRAKFADAVGTAKRIILELREHGRAPERKRPSSAPAETAAQEALSASA
jgi:CHAD domain-containing protein